MSLPRNKIQRGWTDGDQLSAGRKYHSYTDINNQISGYNPTQRWKDQKYSQTVDRQMLKPKPTRAIVDYGFLREILGIQMPMGSRKRSANECFLSEELKQAVVKLRKEAKDLKLEIKDKNWLKTLEDLGDLNDMETDFLEALYMLRNAYKNGAFSSTQSIKFTVRLVDPEVNNFNLLYALTRSSFKG
eukprot:gene4324-20531_t